jgi:riboflavin synthase
MFTGIIEATGRVIKTEEERGNIHFHLTSPFIHDLKIDQSVSHNGVCLTVVNISDSEYIVTAIQETLDKTNLGKLSPGDLVNLERCVEVGSRLDGHIVQGHVDQTAECTEVKEENGSWRFTFRYDASKGNINVQKGSICVNGVSLTVIDPGKDHFSVAIIPYTYEHTNFKNIKPGDIVNIEFDIIGKYVARLMELRN